MSSESSAVAPLGSVAGPGESAPSPSPRERPARPAGQALAAVAGVGAVGLGLSVGQAWFGFGFSCPFRALTGWLCPLCGGTGAGSALLTGQWALAWRLNPLLLVVASLIGLRTLGWLVEYRRRPQASDGRRWLPAAWSRHWLAIAAGVGLLYTLWRNL
ncbi:MAG: DUF2752 domain-containing protein [Propionibacteriaceae bacterium]|jgi:hypothetical protein|nr:DUF2752 domain-containing protein [Propionibacteriaceae bacterium]